MANVQVSDFPLKASPADADVVHLKADSDNGDYGVQISALKTTIVTNQVASNAEAQAATSDTKIMTPLKTGVFLTNKIASQAEAEGATDNGNREWCSKGSTAFDL